MNIFYKQKVVQDVLGMKAICAICLMILIIIIVCLIIFVRYYSCIITRIRNDISISHTSIMDKIEENVQKSISY